MVSGVYSSGDGVVLVPALARTFTDPVVFQRSPSMSPESLWIACWKMLSGSVQIVVSFLQVATLSGRVSGVLNLLSCLLRSHLLLQFCVMASGQK